MPVFLTAMAFVKTPLQLIAVNTTYAFFLASTLSVPIALVLRSVRKHSWDYGIGKFNEISGWGGWVLGLVLGFGLSGGFLTIPGLLLTFALTGGSLHHHGMAHHTGGTNIHQQGSDKGVQELRC